MAALIDGFTLGYDDEEAPRVVEVIEPRISFLLRSTEKTVEGAQRGVFLIDDHPRRAPESGSRPPDQILDIPLAELRGCFRIAMLERGDPATHGAVLRLDHRYEARHVADNREVTAEGIITGMQAQVVRNLAGP
jgi:hypothetical protein